MSTASSTGKSQTATLAEYAAELRLDGVPEHAITAAHHCLIDAVACAIFGSRFEWSRIVHAASVIPPGNVAVSGTGFLTDASKAALIAGVYAHAFELDSLRKPGAGVHPGATVALPALMVAQEEQSSGEELLAAILAGIEVMFRIGAATLHSAEKLGFHAPGITGVFGAATAAARLMNLSPRQTQHALGLAGSMGGGLLRFAAAGSGGMVKRLHLGRAAESGINAARLARAGFEGPTEILEGRFGTLDTYCEMSDPDLLTAGLGSDYEIGKLCIKRYACHVTAQAPVQLLGEWLAEYGVLGEQIASIELEVPAKIASHHAERRPSDMALAQYSVPFMLAFSAYYDLDDPASLTDANIGEGRVRQLAESIEIREASELKGWSVGMKIRFTDGHEVSGEAKTFLGCPENPLGEKELDVRFKRLTATLPSDQSQALLAALHDLRTCRQVGELPWRLGADQPTTATG